MITLTTLHINYVINRIIESHSFREQSKQVKRSMSQDRTMSNLPFIAA